MSHEHRTVDQVDVLDELTRVCPARPGKQKHDTFRTDEAQVFALRGDGSEWIRHVWVCRYCGERVWWW